MGGEPFFIFNYLKMNSISAGDMMRHLHCWTRGFKGAIVAISVAGIINVGCSLLFVWTTKEIVDIATGRSGGSMSLFLWLFALTMVARLGLGAVSRQLSARTNVRFGNRLRSSIFSHLMHGSWAGREQIHSADAVNRMQQDVGTVTSLATGTVPSTIVVGVQLVAAFVFLAVLDMRLALSLVFIMPVAILAGKIYVSRSRQLNREIRSADSRLQTLIQENLRNRVLVSTFGATGRMDAAVESLQNGILDLVCRYTRLSVFSGTAVTAGFMAGYAVTFLWCVEGLSTGAISFGLMTAFMQLVAQVQRPVVDLSQKIPAFIRCTVAVERIDELLATPLEQQGDPVVLDGSVGVRIENATFAYEAGREHVLRSLSHDFAPGTMTLITGHTGAGKSTLLRLILALLSPQMGRVVFYNRTAEAEASPLTRVNISYVPQGNSLMSGTIRDNLLLARPEATDAELRHALHVAAADFVYDLPDGVDTFCGEGGTGLSEGQAQRVAIARALLRPGGILLLDEPTSALDRATEQLLFDRLGSECACRTIIMVTHREAPAGREHLVFTLNS